MGEYTLPLPLLQPPWLDPALTSQCTLLYSSSLAVCAVPGSSTGFPALPPWLIAHSEKRRDRQTRDPVRDRSSSQRGGGQRTLIGEWVIGQGGGGRELVAPVVPYIRTGTNLRPCPSLIRTISLAIFPSLCNTNPDIKCQIEFYRARRWKEYRLLFPNTYDPAFERVSNKGEHRETIGKENNKLCGKD